MTIQENELLLYLYPSPHIALGSTEAPPDLRCGKAGAHVSRRFCAHVQAPMSDLGGFVQCARRMWRRLSAAGISPAELHFCISSIRDPFAAELVRTELQKLANSLELVIRETASADGIQMFVASRREADRISDAAR